MYEVSMWSAMVAYKEMGMMSKMVVERDCDEFNIKKGLNLSKINTKHIIW